MLTLSPSSARKPLCEMKPGIFAASSRIRATHSTYSSCSSGLTRARNTVITMSILRQVVLRFCPEIASTQPKLLVQRCLELEQLGFVAQPRAVDQEYIFGALAERVDLGAGDIYVRLGQSVGDLSEQPGTVAGDDLEDVVRTLVVGKDPYFGRQRKVLEVATDAADRRQFERRTLDEHSLQFELDVADDVTVARVRVSRIVDDEAVQSVAVPRGMHLGLENRQARPAEETADTGEQFLLVGQVDHHLQSGAVAGKACLDNGLGRVNAKIEMSRVPRDLVCGMALEIYGVELPPEPLFRALRDGVQAKLPRGLGAPRLDAVVEAAIN